MRHFLFYNKETKEEFLVGEATLQLAKKYAKVYFDCPIFVREVSEREAENSGLDEY